MSVDHPPVQTTCAFRTSKHPLTNVHEMTISSGEFPLYGATLVVRTDLLPNTVTLAGLAMDVIARIATLRDGDRLAEIGAHSAWTHFQRFYMCSFHANGGDTALCAVEWHGQVIDPDGKWDFRCPKNLPVLPPVGAPGYLEAHVAARRDWRLRTAGARHQARLQQADAQGGPLEGQPPQIGS